MWTLQRIKALSADLFADGHKFVGIIAPLLSVAFTLAKLFEAQMNWLRELSYAWAFFPLLIWVLIAYVRRWHQHKALFDTYAFALHLRNIDTDLRVVKGAQTGRQRFILQLHNSINLPIEYSIRKLIINGTEQTSFSTRGGRMGAGGQTSFYSSFFDVPIPKNNQPESFIVELDIEYGIPNSRPTRLIEKIISVEIIPSARSTTMIHQKDKDTEWRAVNT